MNETAQIIGWILVAYAVAVSFIYINNQIEP